jgi:putative endonuclease
VNAGERRASRHYRVRGFTVLDANAHVGGYELDLVLRRGRTIVFCEVKERRADLFGTPAEMVDGEKRRRVRLAARAWLATHPELAGSTIRFEVAAIQGGRLRRIQDDFVS